MNKLRFSLVKTFVFHGGLEKIIETGTPEEFKNAMQIKAENHVACLFKISLDTIRLKHLVFLPHE